MSGPGRSCPLHYRYGPAALRQPASLRCDALYVVGGLYGNTAALRGVLALFDAEPSPHKHLLFNGDFNWFNRSDEAFAQINQTVLSFDAIRGNVETELRPGADDAGCGCAYPDWVDPSVVSRSNIIMSELQATAARQPALRDRLAALPMWRRVDVGGARIAVVHGDAQSLAGWGFSQEALADPAHQAEVESWFGQAGVDVFASTHTCLPVFFRSAGGGHVLNNGAAGMPNFAGETAGLLTRIATTPCTGLARRFGVTEHGLHMDALAIEFDQQAWRSEFQRQWPAGSPAHDSYWSRISAGPAYVPAQALRRAGSPFLAASAGCAAVA